MIGNLIKIIKIIKEKLTKSMKKKQIQKLHKQELNYYTYLLAKIMMKIM